MKNPQDNQILEHLLVNHHDKSTETNNLLENLVEQGGKENAVEPLLEAGVELQGKILDEMKAANEDKKNVREHKVTIEGLDLLTIKGEKGDKGDKGDIGEKGDSIQGEKGDQGEPGLKGEKGEKGDRGEKGMRGEKGDKGDPGEDGKNGKNGKDGKDGTGITAKQIIEKIKGLFSYNDLKDTPTMFPRMAGTGYLHEITDVNTTGLQHGDILKWNASTNKWERGSIAATVIRIETPSGVIDGSNNIFTITHTPSFIVLNGAIQNPGGNDYTLNGLLLTFVLPPPSGSTLISFYV